MSRRGQAASARTPPAKRRRGNNVPRFGAPTADDALLLRPCHSPPTSTAFSTRTHPQRAPVPSLSSLAARCFVTHIQALSEDSDVWNYSKRFLKILPDTLVPKLFSMLRSSCPTLLSHGLIVLYFLRGPSLVLSSDLPGVQKQTITSIPNNGALRELHLIGFTNISDVVFASIIPSLPLLRVLVLRGCASVSANTAQAIGNSCPSLTTLNLNYTSVSPISLLGPLTSCANLEVLKVAGISNWTDKSFSKLLTEITKDPEFLLPCIRSLKFRQLYLSETSICPFLALCPNLTRLDVSFTRLCHLSPSTHPLPALEKLSLSSTGLSSADTVFLIGSLPNIRTLYLGALGLQLASTMTDGMLNSLTDVISNFEHLEKVTLVGNVGLGMTCRHGENSTFANFIRCVGRKCKYLDLSCLPHLRSQDLCGLISETDHDGPCRLEVLILNSTGIDDEAAQFLACCSSLVILEVAGTKLTSAGLFQIIDACPKLEKLNLTSCRGIRVADRRRFFEVWESEWKNT